MRPVEFFSSLKEGPLLPLYYFYGEERYLQEKAIHSILDRWGEKINRGLNFEIFSGGSTPLSTIIDSARTVPFLGKKKVILIKEAERISTSGNDVLFTYLKKPNPRTTLIFTGSTINFQGNSRISLNKTGLVREFRHPFPSEIPDWIKYMAKESGKSIEPRAIYLILELVGNRLQDIANEMEKLSLFVGERKEITSEDIEKVISSLRVESIFELTNSIGSRKLENALIVLSQLIKSGEPPLKILALISHQFRMITKARFLLDQGMDPEAVKNQLKLRDFIWKKLYPQVDKFPRQKLEFCFQRLWEADLDLKTQRTPKKIVLEQLIMDLCK